MLLIGAPIPPPTNPPLMPAPPRPSSARGTDSARLPEPRSSGGGALALGISAVLLSEVEPAPRSTSTPDSVPVLDVVVEYAARTETAATIPVSSIMRRQIAI